MRNHEYYIDRTAGEAMSTVNHEQRYCTVIESLIQSCREVKLMREGRQHKRSWSEYRAEVKVLDMNLISGKPSKIVSFEEALKGAMPFIDERCPERLNGSDVAQGR